MPEMFKDTNPSNEQETIKCSGMELESGYRQSGERRVVQAGTVCNINHHRPDWLIHGSHRHVSRRQNRDPPWHLKSTSRSCKT